ncbi:MAG: hypothetical protein JJE35_00220 [Thermoleophilia bacterium]|nr:hypothetical protein [Thermoleophilia bacterium]
MQGRASRYAAAIEQVLDRARHFLGRHPIPPWAVGLAVGIFTWQLFFTGPTTGVDGSWIGGLYMAAHDGRDFGTDIVFSYGPLGFLAFPALWYSGLAVVSFLYGSAIYLIFAATLVWVLRRSLGKLGGAAIAFAFLATFPTVEQLPLVLAVAWALMALHGDRSRFAVNLVIFGGATLAAVECLVKLSVGPPIFLAFVIALAGARATKRQWLAFVGLFFAELILLWLVMGQALPDLPDYFVNGEQVASGYNEAMRINMAAGWEAVAAVLGGILVTLGAAFGGSYRDSRARWCAVGLVGLASFVVYKYGVVRFEPNHMAIAMSTLLGFWLVLPWSRRRVALQLCGLAAIGFVALHSYPNPARLDVIENVTALGEQVGTLFSPAERNQITADAREAMKETYDLDPRTLRLLDGRRVDVDPWEVAVAWAYPLNWSPLPVFQNYTAYTSRLDDLNASVVEDPRGPELILRSVVRSFEERHPAWDPPDQNLAVFCNFTPQRATAQWQVLRRTGDRCGEPRFINEVVGGPGTVVAVPQAKRGELVILRIQGVEPSGLGKLRSLLWRPRLVYAYLNDGEVKYRLVPGTADDDLVVSPGPGLDAGGVFAQLPAVVNIRLEGIGDVRYDFYRVKVWSPRETRLAQLDVDLLTGRSDRIRR